MKPLRQVIVESGAVDWALNEAVHRAVYCATREAVGMAVYKTVHRAVDRDVYWATYEAARVAVYGAVRRAVDDAVRNGVAK